MNPEIELIIQARNEAKRALAELQRQLKGLEDQLRRTSRGGKRFGDGVKGLNTPLSRARSGVGALLEGVGGLRLGWLAAGIAAVEFGRQIVNAAAQMETFRNTVRATESSSVTAEARLAELNALGKELVGIDTGGLLKFNSSLRSLGIEASLVDTILSGFVKAGAELGRSVAENTRIITQYVQAVSIGKIQAQDLNTIFRELPQAARAASIAVGEQVKNVQEFNEAAKRGVGERQALLNFGIALNDITRGADLDSYAAQVERLGESWFQLQAALGEFVLPKLADLVGALNDVVEATTDAAKATGEFLSSQDEAIRSASQFREELALATDIHSFVRLIGRRVQGLREEAAELERGSAAWNQNYFAQQQLIDLGRRGDAGRAARARALKQEEDRLVTLNARWDDRENRTIRENRATERAIATTKTYIQSLKNLQVAFKEGEVVTEATEKATRNLRKEVVLAESDYRRAQRIFRNADTVEAINLTTAAALDAVETRRTLRIEEARETIKDKDKLDVRLAEIEVQARETRENIVNEAIKRLAQLERDGYAAAEKAAKDHADRMNRILSQRRYGRPGPSPFVQAMSQLLLDQAEAGVMDALSQQAEQQARRIERDIAEETPNALTRFLTPQLEAALIAPPDISDALSLVDDINEKAQEISARRAEEETRKEIMEIHKRLQAQREYYNAVRSLNFRSVDSFIQSAIRATARYLEQLAIRKAAEQAFAGIGTLAGGAFTGGTGFLIAGGVAVGAGILSSLFSRNESNRTFHNAGNDALVELAVARAMTSRSASHQTFMDNRQQARDVSSAVERGIRSAPDDGQPIVIVVQNVINDKVIQQEEIRRDDLRAYRRI